MQVMHSKADDVHALTQEKAVFGPLDLTRQVTDPTIQRDIFRALQHLDILRLLQKELLADPGARGASFAWGSQK